MKEFKIPRKLKKKLKKGIWVYQAGENGNSRMAWPGTSQDDFEAFKKGVLRNLMNEHNSRQRSLEFREKIDGKIAVPDEDLKKYVDAIMRKKLRRSSYETLMLY